MLSRRARPSRQHLENVEKHEACDGQDEDQGEDKNESERNADVHGLLIEERDCIRTATGASQRKAEFTGQAVSSHG